VLVRHQLIQPVPRRRRRDQYIRWERPAPMQLWQLDARDTLRAALAHAVTEDELLSRNPAGMVRLPAPRSLKVRPWSVAEACAFLESARADNDPLYTAFVLMLVLGLRRGEALGLLWSDANLDAGELDVAWQLQRSRRQLYHRQTKTVTPTPPCLSRPSAYLR
jgi:integrase